MYRYSTVSISDAAYFIGGTNTQEIIAEFKNEKWLYVEDLAQGRIQHDAVTSGPYTMIVGGNPTVASGSS